MKRGHFGKSPKGKGGNYHNKSATGDKRRKSGGRGGASPYGSAAQGDAVAPRRNRSRSGGFQEFGNFLWTYDASTNHWVAREPDSSPPPSSAAIDIASSGGHSKAALRELSDFGREFPAAHKGKKGRGNNSGGGGGRKGQHQGYSKSNPQSSMADDDLDDASAADHAFVGFRSSSSPHHKSASPASASGSSFMMRFVKGETMNDEREKHADDDEAAPPVAVKIEAMQEVKLEVEVKLEQRDVSSHARPVRWQSEPAIPKYTPVVSPSRALGMPSATTPQQAFSGRGRGRGRGRGAAVTNSPTSPADFHWTYTEKTLNAAAGTALEEANAAILGVVIKQEQEDVVVVEPDNGDMTIAMATATTATTTAVPAQGKPGAHQRKNDKQAKKNNKKSKKWEEKQLRNRTRLGLEPMESDSALFTTRDLVRAKMQTSTYDKTAQRNKSSEDDEENAQADEDFLFGRGGREMRKGAPVKGKPAKGKKQQKKGKKGFVYDMDDEDSEDDGMVLDEELIRDYMLNTELDDLNLDEDAMEEHLLLHIVSQLNDYHLSDDDDDDDDDDEEEEGDEDDDSEEGSEEEESDDDDSEEDIYDEYGDDEKEEEKELAKKLIEKAGAKARKTKKTPLGLAAWDDAETAVVDAAVDETFDAVLNADFTLLRSDRPPSFNQRLQKVGGGKWASRDEQRGSPYQRGNKNNKKWKTPEKGGKGRYTKKGKWYDQEFNEETITDEEELPYIDRTPLKGQPRTPNGMVTVHSINESIRNFIANDDKEWLELPPMNKKQRVMVHQLSQLYHLKSKSYGMGRHRFPTLVKTVYSCYPPQAELLEFLNRAAKIKAANGAPAPVRKKLSKEENKQLRKLKNMRKRDGGKETFVSTKREMDGKVVGEGAVPLGQETIGARLLLSMGWSGGGLVGTNGEGIAEPLMAIVKNNRKGLGF